MPNWSVQLTGDKFDLEDLPKWFTTRSLQVVKEADGYYFRSDLFEAIDDADQLRIVALELLECLVGAAKLARPSLRPIGLGGLVRRENDGRKHFYLHISSPIVMRSKVSSVKLTVSGREEKPQLPRPAVWAAIAKDDEKVRQALSLWAKDPDDWVNLYKILEVIQSDVGGAIYHNAWVSKTEVKRFTRTANSAEALGHKARHAKKHIPAPPRPMTILEAKELIQRLLQRWIESKTPS